jgi:tetratricopeptide (TPR) repeat protein
VFWIPTCVALSYLPDVVTQSFETFGLAGIHELAHSMVFPLLAGVLFAWPIARLFNVSLMMAALVVCCSSLIHLLLDFLQKTDRWMYWPGRAMGIDIEGPLIPSDTLKEAALFATFFILFEIVYRVTTRSKRKAASLRTDTHRRRTQRHLTMAAVMMTTGIFVFAVTTHYLRGVRQRQLLAGYELITEAKYHEALASLDRADTWPHTTHPGRIAFFRAQAYRGLGQRQVAEEYYLRSLEGDPDWFWILADLATFYATGPEPVEKKREKASPYIKRLSDEYLDHRNYAHVMKKLDRLIGPLPETQPASGE